MKIDTPKPKNIDEYISGFPVEIQLLLEQVRATIKKAAPQAQEKISYGMPAFHLLGSLVYFAAFKNHIGFYALPSGNVEFQRELSRYKTGKGSIQFQLHEKIPFDLITRIVEFRVKENMEKSKH
jgi:uncharacterized protein YdhG (YjbR/CyaY superfamily)